MYVLGGIEKVRSRGAFGHAVLAELMEVPLSLHGEGGAICQQLLTLCAVTAELAEGVDAPILPGAYEEFKHFKEELEEDARVIRAVETKTQVSGAYDGSVPDLEVELEDEAEEQDELSFGWRKRRPMTLDRRILASRRSRRRNPL